MEPQFNEPLYNKVLSITSNILQPGLLKYMEQNQYNEPICLVPWHFVKIDHFWVSLNLTMKARLSAKLFIRKLVLFANECKLIFIIKTLHFHDEVQSNLEMIYWGGTTPTQAIVGISQTHHNQQQAHNQYNK